MKPPFPMDFPMFFPIFSCEFPSWRRVSHGVFGISAPGCCGPSFPPAAAVVPPLGPVPSSSLGTDVSIFFDVERWTHMVKYMVKYVITVIDHFLGVTLLNQPG